MKRARSMLVCGALVAAALLPCAAGRTAAAQLEILAPARDEVVHDNSGNLTVSVKVDPPAGGGRGQSVRLLLDGKAVADDATGARFSLQGVERGRHWLQALLVDANGRTLAVSDTVYFTMWQASVNSPARRKP
ncbi:MAG TPA: hypothetical protein VFV71_11995 [Burkholderiales bacterium]|nr:hypothetical protein [Burkholderiales bacterium]